MAQQTKYGTSLLKQLQLLDQLQNGLIALTAERNKLVHAVDAIDRRRCEIIGIDYKPQVSLTDSLQTEIAKMFQAFIPAGKPGTIAPAATAKPAHPLAGKPATPPARNTVRLKDRLVALMSQLPEVDGRKEATTDDLVQLLLQAGWNTNSKLPRDVVRGTLSDNPELFRQLAPGRFAYIGT